MASMFQVSIPKVNECVGVYQGVAIFFNGTSHAIAFGETLSHFMYPEIEDAEEAIDICLMPDA
jgi:hypothetical protein